MIGLCIVLGYAVDVFYSRTFILAPLLVRVGWALELLFYAWSWQRVGKRMASVLTALNSVCGGLCFLALISLSGDASGPLIFLVPAFPLISALVQPYDSRPVTYATLTCSLGVLWLLAPEPSRALAVMGLVVCMGFIGAYGAAQFRTAQLAMHEARWERRRRQALQKLTLAERHRTQTEKLATVGRLAADVMHEINNPLAFVRANMDFLREELRARLPEQSREDLEDVLAETRAGLERISGIVSDLKGFSRMNAEEATECALVDVVTDASRLAAIRLRHVARLTVEVPPQLRVFAISRRLAQVVLNLLVNAGDALEQAQVREGQVWVKGRVGNGRVTLVVEDNGPGFPADVLPRVFDAFFTTKDVDKGTGLGLSISRELVERFGGTLRAENRPEGGARLSLELPTHMTPAC